LARSGHVLSETAGAGSSGLIVKACIDWEGRVLRPRFGADTFGSNHLARLASRESGTGLAGASPIGGRFARPGVVGRQTQPAGLPFRQPKESPVDRAAKRELVSTLNGVFSTTSVVVVAHYKGLTVADMQKLRTQMKQAGATVKVAKNRLAKIALEGTDVASISDLMQGPTLIAYSSDPVAAAKVAVDFAKGNEKLVILGGAMGRTALNPDGVKALATMPSLDELRAKLVGLVQAPATKVAQVVNAPAAKLSRVFGAYAKRDEAA
jgi:large subunit ribosomal protein L10